MEKIKNYRKQTTTKIPYEIEQFQTDIFTQKKKIIFNEKFLLSALLLKFSIKHSPIKHFFIHENKKSLRIFSH